MQSFNGLYDLLGFSESKVFCLLASFLSISLVASSVAAQSRHEEAGTNGIELLAKPTSCVALHRGQVCFQSILFSWKVQDAGEYCLYKIKADTPLSCASGNLTGVAHEYSSKSSETFVLKQGRQGPEVAKVTINTAWVYRTGRRSSSSWRLF
ncbi:MAG: DUF3019 domain-containing protein [Granulosicoccus sp.]